jgi:pyruvate/2-oxoglutarate dehydrogenase complex dihydrolipoamide acyltransferase (E2) component
MAEKANSSPPGSEGPPGPLTLSDLEWLDEECLVDSEALDELYRRVEERLESEGKLPVEEEPEDSDGVGALTSDDPLSLAEVEWLDEHSGVDRKAVDVLYERVKERLQEEEGGPAEESGAADGEDEPAPDAGGEKGTGGKTPPAKAPSPSRKSKSAGEEGPRATKGAEELAEKEGLDLNEVEGTGLNGKIKKSDVEKKLAEKEASAS